MGLILSKGINIPLINSSGQRKSVLGIITLPGRWTGKEAKNTPIMEKTQHDRNIVMSKRMPLVIVRPKNKRPAIMGSIDTMNPKNNPTKDLPITMELKGTGDARILSRVFILRSIGSITCPAEEEVKNIVMEIKRTIEV